MYLTYAIGKVRAVATARRMPGCVVRLSEPHETGVVVGVLYAGLVCLSARVNLNARSPHGESAYSRDYSVVLLVVEQCAVALPSACVPPIACELREKRPDIVRQS